MKILHDGGGVVVVLDGHACACESLCCKDNGDEGEWLHVDKRFEGRTCSKIDSVTQ
jgi:hypothetical protein